MKSLLIFSVLTISILCINPSINAQSNWEIGARFGDDFSLDLTVPLAKSPRLHGAVYFNNHFSLGGYFDWMFALSDGPSGLKFYPGVGPEFYFGSSFDVAIAGDFGVEYSFAFPLTIGFDWRPNFMLSNNMNFSSGNWGILARFRFGEGTKFVKSH